MSDIRSFRGPDAQGAFAAVKAALGPDAVILSAREVPGGLLRRPEVEVLAAVPRKQPAGDPARQAAAYEQRRQEAAPARNEAPAPEPRNDRALVGEVLALRRTVEEARREMMRLSQRTRAEVEMHLRPAAGETYNRLVHGGVEDGLAEEVLRQSLDDASAGASARALFEASLRLIGQRLSAGTAPWLAGPRRVVALVGPTGVGKTTTIAKIAARALLDSRMKVALITVDTYRIGASEQLMRYGEIMGVPSMVAKSRDELAGAIARNADAKLILIDTAGRSTSEAVAQQAQMLRTLPGVQLQLVASAATGWRELAAVADRYRPLQPDGLIVTKLDEAAAPGSMLSAAVRLSCPITCVADGQRVPDDLHEVTPADLLRRFMAASGTPAALRANG